MSTATATTEALPIAEDAVAADERGNRAGGRLRLGGLRTRIIVGYIGLLALAAIASVLVAREVLVARLDERIDRELVQEASELRRLATDGIDPRTGRHFGDDVERLFRVYLERNVPSRNEAMLTFINGKPWLRSGHVAPYRLDLDPEIARLWGSVTETSRGRVDTPAGPVEYLATPVEDTEGHTRGVFVVAFFRGLEADDVDEAIIAVGIVGLVIMLIGTLLAWRVAEGVIRPVGILSRTAHELTETDLSRRIHVEGTDQIGQLAATFNAMLDRLETAFGTQRRFLNDVGHELRTPLTIIRGHLEVQGDDPAEREATSAIVLDELDRMSRMVDELITLARAERPDFLRHEPVELEALTEALLSKASALAPRDWRLDATADGEIVADPQRLTQALMELAQNAVAHTEKGQVIALGSALADGEVRVWVRDEGPGIPAADHDRIFDRFVRVTTDRREGAGLGLSIVKAIAEAHGGRVELASRPGEGATFTVVVPANGPPLEAR